ncbi:MAG: hypothetical protein H7336_06210 [Bacteriovorax sp.]|nr:hypothetical protein [Bacteriovorax sp.]
MKNILNATLILFIASFTFIAQAETGSGCETYSHIELKEKYQANFLNKDLQGCFSYSVDDGGIKSPSATMTIRIGNNLSSLNMATTAKIAYEAFTSIVNIERANKILSDNVDQTLSNIRSESKNAAKQIEIDLNNLDRAYSTDALPQLKQNQIDLKTDAQNFALKNSALEKTIAMLPPGNTNVATPDSQISLPKASLDPISKEKERWSKLNTGIIPFRTLVRIKNKNPALADQLLKEIKTERYNRLGLTHVENLQTLKEVQKYERSENLYVQKLSLLKKNPEVLKNYDASTVQTIKEISREFKREADQKLADGKLKDANDTLDLAHISLDIATSLPLIASGRGLYELYTGKNLIDGHLLTTTEKAIAGGMVLLDLTPASVISRGAEIAGILGKVGTQLVERGIIKAGFEEALNMGTRYADEVAQGLNELVSMGAVKFETIKYVVEHKVYFSYLSEEAYLASKTFQKDIIQFEKTLTEITLSAEKSGWSHAEKDALVDVYTKAPNAKFETDKIADEIAESVGGKVAKAPLKSPARAVEKITADYSKDASKIKDVVRNTIIVEEGSINTVVSTLEQKGAKIKIIDSSTNELGYSGINANIITENGLVTEIQVNSPAMIYAKEQEPIARILLGDETYNNIAAQTKIPGGKGHDYYEQWRVLPESPEKVEIENQSKEYYDAIRRAVNNGHH